MLTHVDFLETAIVETYQQVVLLRPIGALVDLIMTIPGVEPRVAEVFIAEVGLDMSVFPSVGHLVSWAGICPGNNSSGGSGGPAPPAMARCGCRSPSPKPPKPRARTKGTHLVAHHAQIRGRRGTQKDIGATRHDILIALLPHRSRSGGLSRPRAGLERSAAVDRATSPPPRAPTRKTRHERLRQPRRLTDR
jgi:transposase